MRRSRKRLILLFGTFLLLLIGAALLYMFGMQYFEGNPRNFWQALQWAAGTLATTGYGSDTSWRHPAMILFVIVVQFMGVLLIFLIVLVDLLPCFEEHFETQLPQEIPDSKDH